MLHKFDAKRAPRVFLLPVIALIVVAGSLTLIVTGQILIGLIALALSAWISYYLVRYTIYQFRSAVESSPTELICNTSMGYQTKLSWSEVTHAGVFMTAKGERFMFAYGESGDELLTIPCYYTDASKLEDELRERSPAFLELEGGKVDELGESLKPYLENDEDA